MSEPISAIQVMCPHCQEPIPPGAPYCPRCGYRIKRVPSPYQQEDSSQFGIGMIIILLFFIPVAACGGCALFDSNAQFPFVLYFAMGIEGCSIVIGCIMLFANFIQAVTRKR